MSTKPPTSNLHPPSSSGLRIGLDAKRAFNNGTGLGNYSRFVINGLLKHFPENEYYLFTPKISEQFADFYAPSPNINLVTPDSLLGKTFPALWRTYAIADMCNALKLDVFHGLSNELPVGINRFKGKKLVTIHDLIFLRYPTYYNNIDRYIYTRKFAYACAQADTVVAASAQTQSDIIRYFKTPETQIEVGYQNCDERFGVMTDAQTKAALTTKLNLPQQFILCVGTLEQRKNQLTVLKAFFEAQLNDTSLVFVGRETEYASELHAFVNQHGLQDKVVFLQNISAADLPVLYQMARVFVYASEFEGFGIPVLEGLRSGIPVLAANSSSLPEVGGTAAQYFQHQNATELADLLKQTISSNPKPSNIEAHLQQFDTAVLMQQLMEFYTR